jgi:hypothetical protein
MSFGDDYFPYLRDESESSRVTAWVGLLFTFKVKEND